jgi:hypothetical protein
MVLGLVWVKLAYRKHLTQQIHKDPIIQAKIVGILRQKCLLLGNKMINKFLAKINTFFSIFKYERLMPKIKS